MNEDECGPADVAKALGVTTRQIQKLIQKGTLIPDRLDKKISRTYYYFRPDTIERLKHQREGTTDATV